MRYIHSSDITNVDECLASPDWDIVELGLTINKRHLDDYYRYLTETIPHLKFNFCVYKVTGDSLVEATTLPTNNITYGPINDSDNNVLFVPYRFDLNDDNRLYAPLTVLNLRTKDSKNINIELDLE